MIYQGKTWLFFAANIYIHAAHCADEVTTVRLPACSPTSAFNSSHHVKTLLKKYTAIGDSYTAGDSNLTAIPGDPNHLCVRREESYPYLFSQRFAPLLSKFNFPACSGANTTVTSSQISSSSGPSPDYAFGSPDIVSITVGGDNNESFTNTISACVVDRRNCNESLALAHATTNTIQPSLEAVYSDAKTRNLTPGQERKVYVLGYARFYNFNGNRADCGDFPTPSLGPGGVASRINDAVVRMNGVIMRAAKAQGVVYVDIDQGFEGHRICDAPPKEVEMQDSLADYFRYGREGYSPFHPTEMGYRSMMVDFARAAGFM